MSEANDSDIEVLSAGTAAMVRQITRLRVVTLDEEFDDTESTVPIPTAS